MYQVTTSQTESNCRLIKSVRKHRCLYDFNDPNYKNSVFIEKGWQEVSNEFKEPVADCKKKWRHLRSSLSRYLKSTKDSAKIKNQKLKPYYLLNQMNFLVPFTKTVDGAKNECVQKYEDMESEHEENVGNSVHQINFEADMKPEESTVYDTISNDIIQEDQEESIEDNEEEEIVYEAYEISDLPATNIQTIQTQNQQTHPKINLLRQNNQTHTLIQQQQQQQQQQAQQTQSTIVQSSKQQIQQQQQATIIPVTLSGTNDDHSSADLNFFLALLPDIKMMRLDQKRKLRIEILQLIDRILNN